MAMSLESSIGNNENWYLLTSIHRLSDDSEASSILTTFSEISPAVTGRLRKGSRGFTGHPPPLLFLGLTSYALNQSAPALAAT